ncbi:MarR family winged helix-turn-helix transcriptional regulator [Elongatibacter sediminis]|uniref:MarR family transcriptional regulator n=1 Tax=Elongatibacter sediminis TaxID=3119006 RepID=A0AAW9RKR1_9GAMM
MAEKTAQENVVPEFLTLIDSLARAHHRMSLYDAEIHRLSGSELTAPQAKVVFCLGGTEGLTCSEITERTLITKGTLTGVIDRLEQKGVVQRWGDSEDGRRIIVDLTRTGAKLYRREYPRFVKAMQARFGNLSDRDCKQATRLLNKIAAQFEAE